MKKIIITYGTRPELIKLAPLILALREKTGVNLVVVNTGQHKEMVSNLEKFFEIVPNVKFEVMEHNQGLNSILHKIVEKTDEVIDEVNPDLIFVQGDTTTVLASALASFNREVDIAHVEAGLRSFDLAQPFPEEFNRKIVSIAAKFNFAPTQKAAQNLSAEKVNDEKIIITGNTVIDSIHLIMDKMGLNPASTENKILITAHRRENHGKGIENICRAVLDLLKELPQTKFIWPVHPNPNVKDVVYRLLGNESRVELVPPLSYFDLLKEMSSSKIIWTDSGGIQEESPTFKKPVIILREVTERPEVIESGFGKLLGTNAEGIVRETMKLLNEEEYYQKSVSGDNPFGDGKAVERILNTIGL